MEESKIISNQVISYTPGPYPMMDVSGMPLEIKLSEDGKSIWINTYSHCVFRAQRIPSISISEHPRRLIKIISRWFHHSK